jgi:hypothetical protein
MLFETVNAALAVSSKTVVIRNTPSRLPIQHCNSRNVSPVVGWASDFAPTAREPTVAANHLLGDFGIDCLVPVDERASIEAND